MSFRKFLITLGLATQEMTRTFVPEGSRQVYINDRIKASQVEYLHNSVSTGKYSLISFLPKFLMEFFSKYANLFFLFTGSIQMIGDLSPTSKFGTVIPLSVIFVLTASKELLEDSKRHAQDKIVNNRMTKVLRGSVFVEVPWRDVKVGDILRVENSEFFATDLVLLSSSEPDALCYIETSNLDGETNLKIRQGIPETSHFLSPEEVARFDAVIKSELPNNSLYTFEALLKWGAKEYPLSPQQLLLRGAQLKNTRWVYGVAVFTGHETKLMMNSTTTPVKRTKVEKMVNSQIIFLFFCLVTMALIGAVGQLFAELQGEFVGGILLKQTSTASALWPDFPKNILTYMILFNNLIPLSLIVTVEFVKLFLGTYINSDLDMYYDVSDTPATARTSTLIEELGQIDFIFSDKTGTLTRNIMEFKMCSIGGVPYAETVPDDKRIHVDENGQEVGYYDFNRLQKHKESGANAHLINEFLTLLAVCHTVIPEHDENDPGKLTYQASSPDEAALVDGASSLGYLFHTRKPKSVTIAVQGINYEYEILTVNEFNSTRKRMSVLVRSPDGKVKLMIKGADTVIYERLAPGCAFLDKTSQNLEDYANEGLRTLVLAYRDIPEFEFQQWQQVYEKASTQINNRQEALDDAAEMIEKDLQLLGATAIEDKLQEGVPDTINNLMEAGIKMWVLTGDRQETAINIGFSCKLITPEMLMMICNEPTHAETKDYLEKKLAAVRDSMGISAVRNSKWKRFWMGLSKDEGKFDKDVGADIDPMALIIDGKTLTFALETDIRDTFLELAMLCKAVVCCRVSPLQKALVVKLVKKNVAGAVTLAIGDGANDVSMIQAAHVGVGISGQEGLQAARAADFAIGQFRFLQKLLLVHGGWAYSRVTKVIVICFYKNITLYLIQFWFALNNNFSGMTLFETWSQVSSYNVVWTLLPPVAIGIFDQYVSARILDRYPQLYQLGQNDTFYNHKVFLGWIANSFLHSLLLFYIWAFVIGPGDILADGRTADNWVFGSMVYVTTLMVVLIKHCLIVDSWVGLTTFAIFGSVAVFMLFFPLWVIIGPILNISPELFNSNNQLFLTPTFWLALLCLPILINLRDFTWKFYKRTFMPQPYHIVQEIQKYNIPDYRPRQQWFKRAVHKVRQIQRMKQTRGFAFSQNESGQAGLIRSYDTTQRKPKG